MLTCLNEVPRVALLGAGATAFMDAWLLALRSLGRRTPDWALVGRWVGHMARGRFTHEAIAKAAPIPGERAIGWAAHYGIGIAFAALLVAFAGADWLRDPSWLPALAVGLATAAAPLFVMQPAMGARARNPLPSIANHAAFGLGLYLAAVALNGVAR